MYWTFKEYRQTREKIDPVSRWWGKKRKDNRPLLFSYIDNMVRFLANESTEYTVDLSFAGL